MAPILRKLDELRLWPYRAMVRRRMARTVLERVGPWTFVVLPHVFNPKAFRSGRVLAEHIVDDGRLHGAGNGRRALDLGTGSGLQAVALASLGYAVTAVDINPQAVRCARINAVLNGMEDRIEVLESDLFSAVADREFDLVVFNPPFFKGDARSDFEIAWRSNDVIDRFAAELSRKVGPDGRALIVWTSHADEQALLGPLTRANLHARAVSQRRVGAEDFAVYEVRR